ncbi:MAG: precorrin-3B C(17)-methyltransferase [Bacteroidales bacterium]
MSKIIVAGIGPGSESDITPAVVQAIATSDVVVGYKYYFRFIKKHIVASTICVDTGMKKERERALVAFNYAKEGKNVCVISSGDAGIYGMAPLIWEMRKDSSVNIDIEVLPGISAFQKAASLLGAPIGHDMCIISLSDLMTPWKVIEKRIKAAAYADFVTAIYNPKSVGRYWQLHRLKELFLKDRAVDTPVGFVRQAGREDEQVTLTTLENFNPNDIDMFTVVIIGNSQSFANEGKFITPRGYYRDNKIENIGIGQNIMIKSFRTIEANLVNSCIPLGKKWALLHAIHTTADFEMEKLLYTDNEAVEKLYNMLSGSKNEIDKTIITDVTMVAAGIRKGALERMGIVVKCYLHDERVAALAEQNAITRTQAGIRLAVQEHPTALYAFGNAPTALMELCTLINRGEATPIGVIAAPVGFVHVEESKYMIKSFAQVIKIIIEGRKGGSNLAATLINSILCFNDAEQLRPGRDV